MSQMRFNLLMPCPKCAANNNDFQLEQWTHGGTCNGQLYIDERAFVHCSRCGKSAHITQMRMSCNKRRHDRALASRKEIAAAVSVGNIGLTNNNLKWFKNILDNI